MTASAEPPLLLAEGIHKRFGGDGAPAVEVLRGVSLEVAESSTLAVVGPSGCGKSTLLSVLGGLLPADDGRVVVAGRELAKLDADELARLRNEQLGFVFQSHHLLPQCSALENVLVPSLIHPRAADAVDRARALLERVGLADRQDHLPAALSGGECQRVAVVRALINGPRVVLADEPTGALDGSAAAAVGDLLVELTAGEGAALVAVTHSTELAGRMQRTLRLSHGAIDPASNSSVAAGG